MAEPGQKPGSTSGTALVIALLACAAIVFGVKSFGADEEPRDDTPAANTSRAPVKLAELTASTTDTTIKKAPRDKGDQAPSGAVVHPRKVVPLYDSPGGTPFAKVGPQQFGDTWLPVVEEQGAWVRVLLPSKPNGSTGWMRTAKLDRAHSRFLIRVHLGSRTVELYEDDTLTDTWTVAVGASDTPTPTGRTFVLGQLVDDQQSFSPVILPLGTHSETLDSYGGGAGTVAFHGWTDPSVFGQAISHGCIRVPDDALAALRAVPIGTAVLIDDA